MLLSQTLSPYRTRRLATSVMSAVTISSSENAIAKENENKASSFARSKPRHRHQIRDC